MITIVACLSLSSLVAESFAAGDAYTAPPASKTCPQAQAPVAVLLSDGSRLAGRLVWRKGDSRPWLRLSGVSTVVMRPLAIERIVTIEPLVLKPGLSHSQGQGETPRTIRRSDAEMAHQLLFGEP